MQLAGVYNVILGGQADGLAPLVHGCRRAGGPGGRQGRITENQNPGQIEFFLYLC